jgi:hypothetical protein
LAGTPPRLRDEADQDRKDGTRLTADQYPWVPLDFNYSAGLEVDKWWLLDQPVGQQKGELIAKGVIEERLGRVLYAYGILLVDAMKWLGPRVCV